MSNAMRISHKPAREIYDAIEELVTKSGGRVENLEMGGKHFKVRYSWGGKVVLQAFSSTPKGHDPKQRSIAECRRLLRSLGCQKVVH